MCLDTLHDADMVVRAFGGEVTGNAAGSGRQGSDSNSGGHAAAHVSSVLTDWGTLMHHRCELVREGFEPTQHASQDAMAMQSLLSRTPLGASETQVRSVLCNSLALKLLEHGFV